MLICCVQGRSQDFQSRGLLERPCQRAKSGDGLFEEGLHQLGDLGDTVSSPSWVRGRALVAQLFFYILSALDSFSCKYNCL